MSFPVRGPVVNQEQIRLTLNVEPPRLPVDLNQVKSQVRETDEFTDDDASLTFYMQAAVEAAEKVTGRAFITRTYSLWLDEWPRGIVRSPLTDSEWWDGVRQGAISDIPVGRSAVEIPRAPTQEIVAVRTYDDADVPTTFAATNYFLDQAMQPARLILRNSAVTPDPQRIANGIEIEFKAGYGDHPHNTPSLIRQAILMMVAFLHENRGECVAEEAGGGLVKKMLLNYKIRRL